VSARTFRSSASFFPVVLAGHHRTGLPDLLVHVVLEAHLPVGMLEGQGGEAAHGLVGDEVVVGHRVGSQVSQVAVGAGALGVGLRPAPAPSGRFASGGS